jgi:hypothetical protein
MTNDEGEKRRTEQRFPPGWDEARVKRLIAHYDGLDEESQVAEDEAATQSLEQADTEKRNP